MRDDHVEVVLGDQRADGIIQMVCSSLASEGPKTWTGLGLGATKRYRHTMCGWRNQTCCPGRLEHCGATAVGGGNVGGSDNTDDDTAGGLGDLETRVPFGVVIVSAMVGAHHFSKIGFR